MAEHLNSAATRAARVAVITLWCIAFGLWPIAAAAQGLPDPTRPPEALLAPSNPAPGGAQPGPVLQSVLVSPTRRVAVISGHTVMQGGKYGDARVVRITETEVTLRNGNDKQILKLFPQVEKHLVSSEPPAKVRDRQRDK